MCCSECIVFISQARVRDDDDDDSFDSDMDSSEEFTDTSEEDY